MSSLDPGRSEVIRAFKTHMIESAGEEKRYVVMVNCGATVDLAQDLGLLEDEDEETGEARNLSNVVVYVADSHRPVDVTNVYSDGQIKLLMPRDEDEGQ